MVVSFANSALMLSKFQLERNLNLTNKYKLSEYKDICDETTLFYDAFYSHDNKYIIIMAAPPYGYEDHLLKATFYYDNNKLSAHHRRLKKVYEIWLEAPTSEKISNITVNINSKSAVISISQNQASRFKGARVISTLCKDTPISWISDWLRFHVDNHNVDALILFENSDDPKYAQQIFSHLTNEFPNIEIEVVHVPFKYGPNCVPNLMFLQPSLHQLLRWKYVQNSQGLLVCDIDELVVCEDDKTIFEKLNKCWLGYLLIQGVWVEPATNTKIDNPIDINKLQHSMFLHTNNPPSKTARKWVVKPSRIPRAVQFKIHGMRPEPKIKALWHPLYSRLRPFAKMCKHFHFRSISTSWKSDRSKLIPINNSNHLRNEHLVKSLQKAGLYVDELNNSQKESN